MPESPDGQDLTTLVNRGGDDGDPGPGRWERYYPELRRLAAAILSREARNPTLQPTALVNEAWLRMLDRTRISQEGSTFFKSCFATECRRILVDDARARLAQKRGGGAVRCSLSEIDLHLDDQDIGLIELHDAIEALAARRERLARIVDMRIFGGLKVAECAQALGVATGTVDNDWAFARAWLRDRLGDDRS